MTIGRTFGERPVPEWGRMITNAGSDKSSSALVKLHRATTARTCCAHAQEEGGGGSKHNKNPLTDMFDTARMPSLQTGAARRATHPRHRRFCVSTPDVDGADRAVEMKEGSTPTDVHVTRIDK